MTKKELQETHKLIGRAKYFYYEKSESIMTDEEFDKLEKEYDKYCKIYDAPKERRWSNIVGFSWDVPLILFPILGIKFEPTFKDTIYGINNLNKIQSFICTSKINSLHL